MMESIFWPCGLTPRIWASEVCRHRTEAVVVGGRLVACSGWIDG